MSRLRGSLIGVEADRFFVFGTGVVWSSRDGSTRCTLVKLHESARLGIFRWTARCYDDLSLLQHMRGRANMSS